MPSVLLMKGFALPCARHARFTMRAAVSKGAAVCAKCLFKDPSAGIYKTKDVVM